VSRAHIAHTPSDAMADIRTRPLYTEALALFVRLVQLSAAAALAPLVSENRDASAIAPTLRNDCGRFRVWAENVGAHRTGRLSLDRRLEEATRVKQLVVDLLQDLAIALRNGSSLPQVPARKKH